MGRHDELYHHDLRGGIVLSMAVIANLVSIEQMVAIRAVYTMVITGS